MAILGVGGGIARRTFSCQKQKKRANGQNTSAALLFFYPAFYALRDFVRYPFWLAFTLLSGLFAGDFFQLIGDSRDEALDIELGLFILLGLIVFNVFVHHALNGLNE